MITWHSLLITPKANDTSGFAKLKYISTDNTGTWHSQTNESIAHIAPYIFVHR